MKDIFVEVTEDEISISKYAELLSSPTCGAETSFVGKVRAINTGKAVTGITYDAHKELTVNVLGDICKETQLEYGNNMRILVVHRIGFVKVGEASVVIGVSDMHRASAFDACRAVLEEIKSRVPIWKKEHYSDGSTKWLKGQSLCKQSHAEERKEIHA